MHLQQTYIDLVSPAYHLWQTGVFLYEPRIDAYHKNAVVNSSTPHKFGTQRSGRPLGAVGNSSIRS